MVETTEKQNISSLLMAIADESCEFLLQVSDGNSIDLDLWYLDTSATNHMSGKKNFFTDLDEEASGVVKFADNS